MSNRKRIVIDKNNYNYFTPLLYQVATSFLEPSSISYPFRKLFRRKDITFRMAANGLNETFLYSILEVFVQFPGAMAGFAGAKSSKMLTAHFERQVRLEFFYQLIQSWIVNCIGENHPE